MSENNLYTTGQFAKKAGVTIRTIRYYDTKGILKPTHINESGYRFYSDEDFVKLKKILALKYLGLSLDEIEDTEEFDFKKEDLVNSLDLQESIIKNKMNNMKVILNAIETAKVTMQQNHDLDWKEAIDVIKTLESEKEILQRSRDTSNLDEGVKLLDRFGSSDHEWYQWVFENMTFEDNDNVLEVGCGNGALWLKNMTNVKNNISITLTEICEEMIDSAKNNLKEHSDRFSYYVTELDKLPFPDNSFDVVIANHILFFMKDVDAVIREIKRVVKPGGRVYCSTIGKSHLKELEELMLSFSSNIRIYEDKLSSKFGLDNGKEMLESYFTDVERHLYDGRYIVNDTVGILEYIYSIPGNILDVIDSKKKDFEKYIRNSIEEQGEICITCNLGMFSIENA